MGYLTDRIERRRNICCRLFEFALMACVFSLANTESITSEYLQEVLYAAIVTLIAACEVVGDLTARNRENYMLFEEKGIRIHRYGKTRYAWLEWDKFHYGYRKKRLGFLGRYLIISENPLSKKTMWLMVYMSRRKLEEGIVIDISGKVGREIEHTILDKLTNITT